MTPYRSAFRRMLLAAKGHCEEKEVAAIEKIVTACASKAAVVMPQVPYHTRESVLFAHFLQPMYRQLCQAAELNISEDKIKSMHAILSPVLAQKLKTLAAAAEAQNVGPEDIMVFCTVVLAAAELFMQMIARLCGKVKPGEIDSLSADELDALIKGMMQA